jgi:hypothetical protein
MVIAVVIQGDALINAVLVGAGVGTTGVSCSLHPVTMSREKSKTLKIDFLFIIVQK